MNATALRGRCCRAIVSFVAMTAACSNQDATNSAGTGGATSIILGPPRGGTSDTSVGNGGTHSGSGGMVGTGGTVFSSGGTVGTGGTVLGSGGTVGTGGTHSSSGGMVGTGGTVLGSGG